MKRDFLSVSDFSKEEVIEIIRYGIELKRNKFKDRTISGKSIGLIFMKQSTRTRLSFEVGVYQMGGQPIYISGSSTQMSRGEDIKDTARVMSRYLDGIVIRTFSHKEVQDLARYSSIPVINALTDYLHPCQVMADLMTMYERFGTLKGKKVTYIGDGNNMANTWLIACGLMGIDISIATPEGYEPNGKAVLEAVELAKKSGAKIELTIDPLEAARSADVLYTDVWVSMGQEGDKDKKKVFEGYSINEKVLSEAKDRCIVMHCLPAHKGEEITEDIFERYSDIIFDQAENRLHIQKAIMSFLFRNL
ncbi:MAG: ornithine carbamoyltransferase [Hydrogenothermaceae bacterium]|nr:ornithine carbamoyltransferase [Hydrogenothermaceae bacterium]